MARDTIKIQDIVQGFCHDSQVIKNICFVRNIDAFAEYNELIGCYKILEAKEFERIMFMFILEKYPAKNLTQSIIKDVINFCKIYINRVTNDTNNDYIALKDGLLNLTTFKLEPHNADKCVFYHIPFSSTEISDGKHELWDKFLNEVLVDKDMNANENLISLTQEMMGYYLLNTLEGHAAFFLLGEGGNGKSVLLNILREMVGHSFATSMNVEDLTLDKFATSTLIGKKINICVEDESTFVRSDKFKAMISGDEISVERKYGSRFLWKPTTKHIFATNEMPAFSGYNYALIRRIKIIPFNYQIPEDKKDTKLTDKLLHELAGITSWALSGAKRLVDNGFKFSGSELSADKLEEFKYSISAAVMFVKENYIEDENGFVSFDDLYAEYCLWCERKNKKKQNFYNFIKDVNRSMPMPQIQSAQEGEYKDGKRLKAKDRSVKIEF